MKYFRYERVSSLIQAELGKIILKEIETPGVLITVTRVEVNKDLERAIINFSVIPSDKSGEILKILEKDESSIEFIEDRLGHDKKYSVDWSKINKELGWKPDFDFDTWLVRTVDWYKENESWWKKIKNGDYQKYYESQYGNL